MLPQLLLQHAPVHPVPPRTLRVRPPHSRHLPRTLRRLSHHSAALRQRPGHPLRRLLRRLRDPGQLHLQPRRPLHLRLQRHHLAHGRRPGQEADAEPVRDHPQDIPAAVRVLAHFGAGTQGHLRLRQLADHHPEHYLRPGHGGTGYRG